MSKVRYKIRREQLERVVEHFVMESAMIEKNAAKKHKMSMGAEQSDDMGDGMIPAKEVKNPKIKQAPEVKKHIKGNVSEAQIKKAAKHYNITEGEVERRLELLREFDEKAFMEKFNTTVKKSYPKLSGKRASEEEMNNLYNQAKDDNFNGDVKINKVGGEYELAYVPSGEVTGKAKKASIWQRMGMVGSGGKA
jgi:hypothetical protein